MVETGEGLAPPRTRQRVQATLKGRNRRKRARQAFHLTMASRRRLWDKTAWSRPAKGWLRRSTRCVEPRRLQTDRRALYPHHRDRVKRAPHRTQRAPCAAQRVIQHRPFRPPRVWAQHLQRQHMRRAHRHTPAAACAALQVDGGLGLAGCSHGGQHSAGEPQWGFLARFSPWYCRRSRGAIYVVVVLVRLWHTQNLSLQPVDRLHRRGAAVHNIEAYQRANHHLQETRHEHLQ